MDADDEISNLVALHMGMFDGGWKWQDLQGLLWKKSLQDEFQPKVSVADARIANVHNELRPSLQKMKHLILLKLGNAMKGKSILLHCFQTAVEETPKTLTGTPETTTPLQLTTRTSGSLKTLTGIPTSATPDSVETSLQVTETKEPKQKKHRLTNSSISQFAAQIPARTLFIRDVAATSVGSIRGATQGELIVITQTSGIVFAHFIAILMGIRLQGKMEAWKHTGLERPDKVVLNSQPPFLL
ncbi:hypothetical protein Tco_0276445 [Tanacetum coccineum]